MAVKKVAKSIGRTLFNPRAWLSYDFVKSQTLTVFNLAKFVLSRPSIENPENFEEAKQRLNLSDADIESVKRTYFTYALIFMAGGVFGLIASVYFLTQGSLHGFILALPFSVCLFAQAFRNHFWYFQIKHRKLGCTFDEWRSGRVNNEGS